MFKTRRRKKPTSQIAAKKHSKVQQNAEIPDIQDQQSAELEHERLVSLINSMADGVIATDRDGAIVVTNGAALNILDSNSSLTGQSLFDALELVDDKNQPIDLKDIVLSTKVSTSSRDWRIRYEDGSIVRVYTSIAPVKLGYGKGGMQGYVVLIRDITREKSLEEERDEFISVVSHELRTPIAISEGNIGNAVFLFEKSGVDNPVVKKALDQAHEQITFLAGMVNDLATLSRAERGKLTLEVEKIDVHELVNEVVEAYQDDAEAKGLKLRAELDPHLDSLESSKLYTKEILQNFVTNAIKYTEEGEIVVGAHQADNGIDFLVRDTGIGISKSDREKVFDKFFRSEDFRTRANSGTGLGLYVTMKLARLLHGEVDLQSQLNKGSTFTIRIPNIQSDDTSHKE